MTLGIGLARSFRSSLVAKFSSSIRLISCRLGKRTCRSRRCRSSSLDPERCHHISHCQICPCKTFTWTRGSSIGERVLPIGGDEKRARFRCPIDELLLHLLGPEGGALCQEFRRGCEDMAMVMFGVLLGEERRQIGPGAAARVDDSILVDRFFGEEGLADGWQSSETTIDQPGLVQLLRVRERNRWLLS